MPFEIQSHVAALDLNTGLFFNALRDVSDDEARRRLGPGVNSAAFIAAHMVDARHYLLAQLGVSHPNPMDAHGQVRSEDELSALPALAELRAAWLDVAAVLRSALLELTPERAAADAATKFPIALPGTLGAVVFMLHHESYHLGQLGLLRKHLGHPAMAYTPAPEAEGA